MPGLRFRCSCHRTQCGTAHDCQAIDRRFKSRIRRFPSLHPMCFQVWVPGGESWGRSNTGEGSQKGQMQKRLCHRISLSSQVWLQDSTIICPFLKAGWGRNKMVEELQKSQMQNGLSQRISPTSQVWLQDSTIICPLSKAGSILRSDFVQQNLVLRKQPFHPCKGSRFELCAPLLPTFCSLSISKEGQGLTDFLWTKTFPVTPLPTVHKSSTSKGGTQIGEIKVLGYQSLMPGLAGWRKAPW